MTEDHAQKLMASTKKQIEVLRQKRPGHRSPAFTKDIWNNIRTLTEHFTHQEIMRMLALSSSQLAKAKDIGSKASSHQFVEVRQTSSSPYVEEKKGRIIMEFRTGSGMTISIYE